MRFILKVFWNAMAVFGMLCIAGGIYAAYHMAGSYDLTPRQIFLKAANKLGVGGKSLNKAVSPSLRYAERSFQGKLQSRHPRVFFRNEEHIEKLRQRYLSDQEYRKSVDALDPKRGAVWGAVAWVCGQKLAAGREAIRSLLGTELSPPNAEGSFGNGMDIAIACDLIWEHPELSVDDKARLHVVLRRSLEESLAILDGDSASLWHGRFQLACSAWIVASVLDAKNKADQGLISRAQAHFLEAVKAIYLTGGWPEGYNYWINNRAFPFVVACLAHMNSVENKELNKYLLDLLINVGLWTIYGTEPIGRFCLFGDSGPRNDLKDETQRVIDLITLATGLPLFRDYSRYLQGLVGDQGYYSAYRWGLPLFRGLPEWDFAIENSLTDLSMLEGRLKASAVFGRDAFGQAFIRSGWGPDATFISFQAGHSFTHHGHYKAGHFTITKRAPLAISSGTYGGYTSPHRLNYYIRTVAANSLLVLRPGEKVKPNRFFTENVADGGQRITMPTGSAVVSVEGWRSNLNKGRHYEGGKITAFDNSHPEFVYINSDLTGAYNSAEYDDNGKKGKVSRISRQLVYLSEEDLLIIRDKVATTDASYTKKWLLHSWAKPETDKEEVLVGSGLDGILETRDKKALIQNGEGKLQISWFFPEDAVARKVGGPNYRYYVETDGDESSFDGVNMVEGANEKPWFDSGMWRIEIQPPANNNEETFLVVLSPSIKGESKDAEPERLSEKGLQGIVTRKHVVLFADKDVSHEKLSYNIRDPGKRVHIVVGIPSDHTVRGTINGEQVSFRTSANGVLSFPYSGDLTASVSLNFGEK